MRAILLGLIAAASLMFAAPQSSEAHRWGPRPYYRAYYGVPYRAAYRPLLPPYGRPRVYAPYAYPPYAGPGYYYGGPGVYVGVY